MATNFPSVLDGQVVSLLRLVCVLQHVHHQRHEDEAVGIRLRNALLAAAVESRRDVLFNRRQQLCGGDTRIAVEFAIEEFRVDAFEGA